MKKSRKPKSRRQPQPNDNPCDGCPAQGPDAASCKRQCHCCVYARWVRPGISMLFPMGWMSRLMCVNCDDSPGEIREVSPTWTCPNFRARREPPVRLEEPTPPNDEIRYIALTKGKFAIVDAADHEWLSRYKWSITAAGYACRMEDRKMIYMHREIMQPPDGMCIDHADGNRLLNRRCNLRICTHRDNMRNRRKSSDNKLYKGVFRHKGSDQYYAKIGFNGEQIIIGYYDDPIEAARAYDAKAKELFGEFARLNFPDERP